jgi:hypothetical protein
MKTGPQSLQTPLPFEPGKEVRLPENPKYLVESVIPWIWSTQQASDPVLRCILQSVKG